MSKLPDTITAIKHHLKNPEEIYLDIVLCRGALFALAEQKTNTLPNLRKKVIQLTGIRCSPYRLKIIYDELENLNFIQRIPTTEIQSLKGDLYDIAKKRHIKYINEHPGQRRDGTSIHDKIYHYFITPEGDTSYNDLKKIFKNSIKYEIDNE